MQRAAGGLSPAAVAGSPRNYISVSPERVGLGRGLVCVPGLCGQVAAVQSIPEQRLYDCLAADVQHGSFLIQLTQHGSGEINIHTPDNSKAVCEVGGDILSTIRHLCNLLCIERFRHFRQRVLCARWAG